MLIPLRKAIELTGLSSTTLRKYADNGFIKSTRGKGGHRLFDVDELVNFGETEEPKGNPVVCYCGVSSKKQNDDLVRQVANMRHKFPDADIIQDIGF